MPRPSDRNNKRRKVHVKVPGNKSVERRLPRKASKAKCSGCKGELHGVPRQTNRKPKTSKRPERPYGGNLCTKCMRQKILLEARV